MTLSLTDLSYVKSKVVTDSDLNGGRMGTSPVISGARHSLFKRVTKTERVNGVTRYRKQFWKNSSASDDIAYDLMQWMEVPSNAGDIFYLAEGTHIDTQSDLTSPPTGSFPIWFGAGYLKTALLGGETSVAITMEKNDFVFPNGGMLHIANKIQTSQTVVSTANIGDSIQLITGTWQKITSTPDITYPKGVYLGSNKVLTLKEDVHEEWLTIAENLYANESIGTGTGFVTPALSTLAHKTKGICQIPGKLPVVTTATAADVVLTAYIRQDGSVDTVEGDASAGQLNMATGVWTTPITWKTAPGSGRDILITYREKPYTYTSNDVVVSLDDQVSSSYEIANTTASVCLVTPEVKAYFDSVVFTNGGGNGEFDSGVMLAHCAGAVRDTITLTFSNASTYTVAGVNSGVIGSSTTGSVFVAKNPETNQNMFTIPNTAWSGTILAGNTLVFELYPASQGVWMKEFVPPGTAQEPHNLCIMGFYLE